MPTRWYIFIYYIRGMYSYLNDNQGQTDDRITNKITC